METPIWPCPVGGHRLPGLRLADPLRPLLRGPEDAAGELGEEATAATSVAFNGDGMINI